MEKPGQSSIRAVLAVLIVSATGCAPVSSQDPPAIADPPRAQVSPEVRALAQQSPLPPPSGDRIAEDRSGRKQSGKASVYSSHFQGKKMASGRKFDQRGKVAASKTLPLGTVAKVTNLQNGRTAIVTVEDRGPFVDGRTVDVSKATAEELGLGEKQGIAPVIVAPVAVPQPDGSVKPGAGAMPGPATAR